MSTIFAVSSGRPPAAIAVVRISGPQAFAVIGTLTGTVPAPRRASMRMVRDADGRVLDHALILVFPGPGSATGEDLAEIQCHGGRAVVDAIERRLAGLPGLRRAEAGEFTRRALTHGRIDLAQAEGLADLLAAETERQRRAAMDAVAGRFSMLVRGWLDRIAMLAARVEATLDFADEDDVGQDDLASVRDGMAVLAAEMAGACETPAVERLRDGVRVVLAGPPNSGKSTLINLMSDRDVAIVSPISGTTRDRIEAPVVRNGIPYVLTDTAGLVDTHDAIERIGVARATAAIESADLVLWLGDDAPPERALWLYPRADDPARASCEADGRLPVAQSDQRSLDRLWEHVEAHCEPLLATADQLALSRHQQVACRSASDALSGSADDPLVLAEQLRIATKPLAAVLGVDATEAMLDALFARFCIGK